LLGEVKCLLMPLLVSYPASSVDVYGMLVAALLGDELELQPGDGTILVEVLLDFSRLFIPLADRPRVKLLRTL
jgi:hypothetical protein